MTGFGEASRQIDGVHYSVELRSLNNRYFKSTLRLPDEIAGLEAELDVLLRKRISRGSVTLTVGLRDDSATAAYELNEAALQRYIDHLKNVEVQAGGMERERWHMTIDLSTLLQLPGVVQPPRSHELMDRCRPIITELVEEAYAKLSAMRDVEGKGIAAALMDHRRFIADRLEVILARAPGVVEEYHLRLRARVEQLMARAQLQVIEQDLIREVAVFADKCDIAEEAQRLKAHLDHIDAIVHQGDGEPAGRTLDFLSQELLREANTIASKSNDAEISRTIVEIKGAIDRIKEQVQNVE